MGQFRGGGAAPGGTPPGGMPPNGIPGYTPGTASIAPPPAQGAPPIMGGGQRPMPLPGEANPMGSTLGAAATPANQNLMGQKKPFQFPGGQAQRPQPQNPQTPTGL